MNCFSLDDAHMACADTIMIGFNKFTNIQYFLIFTQKPLHSKREKNHLKRNKLCLEIDIDKTA